MPPLPLAGLVLLGYPLHPPGSPTERRDAHLPAVARPMLFVQGTRDAFGTPAELAPILAPRLTRRRRCTWSTAAITRSSWAAATPPPGRRRCTRRFNARWCDWIALTAAASGWAVMRSSSTGRPPIRCSWMMRSSTGGSQRRTRRLRDRRRAIGPPSQMRRQLALVRRIPPWSESPSSFSRFFR